MNVVRSISGGLFAGTALALIATLPAAAQEEFTISQGGWEGGAYAQPGNDTFSHCGISRDVTEDLTVVFSLNPRYNLNVGFLRSSWSLTEGDEANVTVDVDGELSRQVGALPASANLLIVPLGRDDDLVNALKRGQNLNASIERTGTEAESISVPLSGTLVGLGALESCIDTALELGVADQAPPAAPQQVPGVDPSAPMDRQTLAELLRAAGFDEVRFAPAEQVPRDALELSHVWQVGPVVGGLHQEPRQGDTVEIDAFAEEYVGILENRCPGTLNTEFSETHIFDDRYALRYDLVECTAEEGSAYVSLLFSLDDYHYSVFFHEGDPDARDVAQEATLRIDQVIRVLAGFDTARPVEDGEGAGFQGAPVGDDGGTAPAGNGSDEGADAGGEAEAAPEADPGTDAEAGADDGNGENQGQ